MTSRQFTRQAFLDTVTNHVVTNAYNLPDTQFSIKAKWLPRFPLKGTPVPYHQIEHVKNTQVAEEPCTLEAVKRNETRRESQSWSGTRQGECQGVCLPSLASLACRLCRNQRRRLQTKPRHRSASRDGFGSILDAAFSQLPIVCLFETV